MTIQLTADNDKNGNPRRLWVVWDAVAAFCSGFYATEFERVLDEGHLGRGVLAEAGYGPVVFLGSVEVPVAEYLHWRALQNHRDKMAGEAKKVAEVTRLQGTKPTRGSPSIRRRGPDTTPRKGSRLRDTGSSR